jgi:hypothetical protein
MDGIRIWWRRSRCVQESICKLNDYVEIRILLTVSIMVPVARLEIIQCCRELVMRTVPYGSPLGKHDSIIICFNHVYSQQGCRQKYINL